MIDLVFNWVIPWPYFLLLCIFGVGCLIIGLPMRCDTGLVSIGIIIVIGCVVLFALSCLATIFPGTFPVWAFPNEIPQYEWVIKNGT